MKSLEIRADDILQVSHLSHNQKVVLKGTMFDMFLEADKVFGDYPCTLAITAEGIESCPEWVEHIKKNLYRYKIELHGYYHHHFGRLTEEQGYEDLNKAMKLIEETFGVRPTTWYVPFGRKSMPEWGERVCQRLGIKLDVPTRKTLPRFWFRDINLKQVNFHFWCADQVELIKEIIDICKKSQ